MTGIDFLQQAIFSGTGHSSQVLQSIQNFLTLPPQVLGNLQKDGLLHLNSALTPKDYKDIDDIVTITVDNQPIDIEGRGNFRIIARELPEIHLTNCHHFDVDLSQLNSNRVTKRGKFQITLTNCSDFKIHNGDLESPRSFCLIDKCSNFTISRMVISKAEGYGIIVFNSKYFLINFCRFEENLASGVYCLGCTSYGRIENNLFLESIGHYNWDAGLHINHCTPAIKAIDIPEKSHENARILDKILKPSFLYVRDNVFSKNRSQGIYCEGCTLSVIEHNLIEGNNKEGICLDWGSALNLFSNNTLTCNGQRASMTKAEIQADFIEHHPLLPDGSSSCKLPALSIDNGALNIIRGNKLYRNFGGGIKMVRTGIANIIDNNMIADNGLGTNEYFPYYHGITLLGMGKGNTEFTPVNQNLDFLPSAKNIIAGNLFSGQNQVRAVYAEPGCADNYVSPENLFISTPKKAVSENLQPSAPKISDPGRGEDSRD